MVLAAAVALPSAGCAPDGARAEEREGAGAGAAVPVRLAVVGAEARPERITASGDVDARTETRVAFQVAGRVVAVGPEEGEEVRAGDVLARLDGTEYRLGLEQAAAAAEQAGGEAARWRPLLAAGSVAPSDMAKLENAARQTAAAAGLARERLEDTRLTAPIAGVGAERSVEPGETVAPGTPVFTIVDLDPVRVRIGVPESEIGKVRAGRPATVRVPALGGRSFSGTVTLVGVAADPVTRTFAVEVSVPNPARVLRAGMVAEATVEGPARVRSVSVPAEAVVHDVEGATRVFLYDAASGRARARRVEVGGVSGGEVEITRGLTGGERVVVEGQHRLREGVRVSPVGGR
jgi:membrane fusion protein (multidrug efflux system)